MPSVMAWMLNSSRVARDFDNGINGLVGGIHRTSAHVGVGVDLAVGTAQADGGGGHSHRAAGNLQAFEMHKHRADDRIHRR